MDEEGRWPPIYDFEQLAEYIDELARDDAFDARFYLLTSLAEPQVCQGDVVHLPAPIPAIADDGKPILTDDVDHWLVVGNTCDFDRPVDEVSWTQAVPILDLGTEAELGSAGLAELRRYSAYRGFYVPPWQGGDDHHRLADFTRIVPIHKLAFREAATVVARMQRQAWVLLHSCLVRFLARDDGRHD